MMEKVIEKKVSEYAKKNGVISYKINSVSCRGLPDRMFLNNDGGIYFIEFKQKGKRPTELQSLKIKELQERGFKVSVIDNIEDGLNVIDEFK